MNAETPSTESQLRLALRIIEHIHLVGQEPDRLLPSHGPQAIFGLKDRIEAHDVMVARVCRIILDGHRHVLYH